MKRFVSCLLVICFASLPGIALGVAVPKAAWGQVMAAQNHSEPGSILVFPKFLNTGNVTNLDGSTQAASTFEISIVCPNDIPAAVCPALNAEFNVFGGVPVKAKWVCPPAPGSTLGGLIGFCGEADFMVKQTITGTIVINVTGDGPVTQPACPQGFLIAWVVSPLTGLPISFNGLIGDAVLRFSTTEAVAYHALSIRSDNTTGTVTSTVADQLSFNQNAEISAGVPVGYEKGTNTLQASVHYSDSSAGIQTELTLANLNIDAGNFNTARTFDYSLFDENENLHSFSRPFICWDEFDIAAVNGTVSNIGTPKGLVTIAQDPGDSAPAILAGLVITHEAIPGANGFLRGYAYWVYYDRRGTSTGAFNDPSLVPPLPAPPPVPVPGLP